MTTTATQLLEGIGREEIRITEARVTPLSYKPADGSFVHICGPVVLTKMEGASTLPNPEFPHAMERARLRSETVAARYAGK